MALSIIGNALTTNGSTQYAGRTVVSTATDNFSVVCWVNLAGLPGAGLHAVPFCNGAADGNGYRMQVDENGVYNFDFSFVANMSSGYTLSTGTWYQLAAIRTSGTTQLYVDAVAQGTTAATTPNAPGTFVTVGALRIAAGTGDYFFNGAIDDVRHYNRAITTTELTQLYNRRSNTRDYADISSTSLISHWKMDEFSGTSCADSSASAAPLTTANNPTFTLGTVEIKKETKLPSRPRPYAFYPGIAR